MDYCIHYLEYVDYNFCRLENTTKRDRASTTLSINNCKIKYPVFWFGLSLGLCLDHKLTPPDVFYFISTRNPQLLIFP